MTLTKARLQAAEWARNILRQDPLILDTETTGLEPYDEICQIAIIDADGKTLLDTLVKPTVRISYGAMGIHRITDAQVADAPTWSAIAPPIHEAISHRPLVIYNADFDLKLMSQSSFAVGSAYNWRNPQVASHCAMLQYAKFYGAWNDYRDDWAWQKLDVAVAQQGLDVPDAPAHSALGDCLRTLAIVRAMAWAAGEAVPT